MREYRVLGPLEVRLDGSIVDVGSPKQRAVLGALLVARGAVVSVDRLIDTVWGANPPGAATTSLQAYISNLRRALRGGGGEPSPIERVNPGYRLDLGADTLDLIEFYRLVGAARVAVEQGRWSVARQDSQAALAASRGGLLEEIGEVPWVVAEAASVAESRFAAQEINITALLADGDTGAALSQLVALRALDPLRDRGAWLHMVALYRAGRATESLEVYAAHVSVLDAELGLDPGVELRELHSAILRHDPVIAAWPRPPHWSGATAVCAPVEATPLTEKTFGVTQGESESGEDIELIGRAAQRRTLRDLYAPGPRSTRWLALCGPAGIGKTRLAQEAARLAEEAGERVAWVRCPESEGTPAWWPLRQLCRALDADPAQVLSVPLGVDADTARFAVYERVQALLETAAATGPVTVIVDDAQWADAMTLGLLTYLTAVLRALPVCVVLTLRDGEGGSEVDRFRAALARADGHAIEVPQLARDEIAQLVRAVADEELDANDLDTLAARAGGNPLFVSEFARLPREQRQRETVPAAVRSVLDRRLASLDATVLEVIGHAAVLGEDVDVALLAQLMDRDLAVIADNLDEAADERIVVASASHGRTRFAHALLRDEALATIRPLRRCRIHLRVAEILAASNAPGAIARRAAHLLEALPVADIGEVVAACRAAADEATAQWDSENAAYWLTAALRTYESTGDQETTERDLLLIAMLAAQARAGHVQVVLETVQSRLYQVVRGGATATAGRLASALIRSGGGWPWIAPTAENESMHAALAAAAGYVGDDPASLARVLAAEAIGQCYHRDAAVPAQLLSRADELAAACGDIDVTADVTLARLITYSGVANHADESIALARRLQAMDHADHDVDVVIADSVLTMATMTVADVAATDRHLRRGIAGSERLRLPILRAQLRWMEASVAVWRGEFDLAQRHFRTAIVVHEQTELYVAGSGAIAMMAMAAERGILDEIIDTGGLDPVTWARTVSEQFTDNQVVLLLAAGVASIAGAEGDTELAESMITAWLADDRPMIWTSLCQAVLLAHVVADLGLLSYAQQFIDYLLPFQDCIATVGQVGCIGPVALPLAQLSYLVGDEPRGDQLLARARELAESGGGTPSVLRCRLVAATREPHSPGRSAELAEIEFSARSSGLARVADAARGALTASALVQGQSKATPSASSQAKGTTE